jgi:hypothetical protein
MPAKQKLKPGPKAFDVSPVPNATTELLKLTLAWTGVLIPLGWGIFKTLQKAAILLGV